MTKGNEDNWIPPIAAWIAALKGDFANAAIASVPGGVEAQEARGQRAFVASETLPIRCFGCTREQLKQIGITFGEPIDDLFIAVQLPEGWRKDPTDHSMWSNLVDDKGRTRAKIFYKAAFYDRRANISLVRRFNCRVEPVKGWSDPNYRKGEWQCVVIDCGKTIWQSQERLEPEPDLDYDDEKYQAWCDWHSRKDVLADAGRIWLDEHYPGWQDDLAYWD